MWSGPRGGRRRPGTVAPPDLLGLLTVGWSRPTLLVQTSTGPRCRTPTAEGSAVHDRTRSQTLLHSPYAGMGPPPSPAHRPRHRRGLGRPRADRRRSGAGRRPHHARARRLPHATALPSHVSAPYFEAYNGDSLSGLATASGNKYLTMAFIQTAVARLLHAVLERRHLAADRLVQLRQRHQHHPGRRRRRHPVLRRLRGRQRRHRDRRQLHRRHLDRRGLREGHHHLRRQPDRPRHRGQLADQRGRHRPPQQGDQDGRRTGPRPTAAPCSSPTPCRPPRTA